MDIQLLSVSEWEEASQSIETSVFHTPELLGLIDDHYSGELQLFAGYRGEQLVAIFPTFVKDWRFATGVFSPPPGFGLPHVGPLLMPASPKPRKRERLNRQFTEGVIERVSTNRPLTLFRTECRPEHTDPRPFNWAGLAVETKFTYRLDIVDRTTEDVLKGFSSSLRREINSGLDSDITVEIEGVEGARHIFDQLERRYTEQGRKFPVSWPFVRDVVETLDERCRVFVARDPEGAYLSGIIALYSDDTAYLWQGGARQTYRDVSTNSLVHWRIIEDLIENPARESVERYDFFGADLKRLSGYKSKFGGRLVPHYAAETAGAEMKLARTAYKIAAKQSLWGIHTVGRKP